MAHESTTYLTELGKALGVLNRFDRLLGFLCQPPQQFRKVPESRDAELA
jgi:hypothetical protein